MIDVVDLNWYYKIQNKIKIIIANLKMWMKLRFKKNCISLKIFGLTF